MFHIIIFFIVLLIFLHVRKHRLTSNDMEVLLFNGTKQNLELMCDFKQPILFQINSDDTLITKCNYDSLDKKNYDMDLLKENGFLPFFETDFLRPSFISYPIYSIILNSFTNYIYHISFRQYFLVSQGSVTIHLVSPNNTVRLNENLCAEPESENVLPITLKKDDCLFIPPQWSYKLIMEEKSSVLSFNYKTVLNIISYFDYYILEFLQNINTKYKFPINLQKIEMVIEKKDE
uniref:Cupin-like domain-containing protein n=1 Tax=viral metagenome TaxID=1070528 RepID=A0A6C0HS72_9ZZZZ